MFLNSEGEVLAEYNKPGIAASDPYSVHAVTKSWIAVLICMLIDVTSVLALSRTLGEVWPGTEWPDGVIDAAQKQRITIAELLSMTSACMNRRSAVQVDLKLSVTVADRMRLGGTEPCARLHIWQRDRLWWRVSAGTPV